MLVGGVLSDERSNPSGGTAAFYCARCERRAPGIRLWRAFGETGRAAGGFFQEQIERQIAALKVLCDARAIPSLSTICAFCCCRPVSQGSVRWGARCDAHHRQPPWAAHTAIRAPRAPTGWLAPTVLAENKANFFLSEGVEPLFLQRPVQRARRGFWAP